MAHILSCACGERLRVPAHLLGGKAKCSACKAVLDVPKSLRNGSTSSAASSSVNEPVKFCCPYCDKKLQAKKQSAGKLLTCPGCDESIVIPKRSNMRVNGRTIPSNDISDLLDEVEQEQAKTIATAATCPHCAAEVEAIDNRCPECRRELVKTGAPTKRRRISRVQQHAVGWGISFVYFGLILSIATFALGLIGVVFRANAMVFATVLLDLLVIPIGLTGKALCIAAPARFGQRFAVLATLVEIVALVLWFNPVFGTQVRGFDPTPLLANAASILSYVLFLTFLVELASCMKQSGAAVAAQAVIDRTLKLIFVPPFVLVLVGVLSTFFAFAGPYVIIIMFLAAALFILWLFILWLLDYLQLLSFLRACLLD